MRLLLILSIVVALGILLWRSFNQIIFPPEKPKPALVQKAASPSAVASNLPTQTPAAQPPAVAPLVNPPVNVEVTGGYVFKNRPVPPPPFGRNVSAVGSGPDSRGLELSVDSGANAWIMRGPPQEVEHVKRIAEFVDLVQTEMDLDFLLIGVSADWLRRFGLTAAYQAGATWTSSFTLGETGDGLRLASGNFSVAVDAEFSDSSARLVSCPVVRCITGEPWEFGADQRVPVATLTRSEGVVATAYEYQDIGLGFEGTLYRAGPSGSYRLNVKQRNGSVEGTQEKTDVPPRLKSQTLSTSLVVELNRWSCIGGVSSWKVERSKHLLGFSNSEEQELLLVFVRPRDSLGIAPRAIPVGNPPAHLAGWSARPWDLGPNEHPLLPGKGWNRADLDAEIQRVEDDIRQRLGHPSRR